MAVMYSVAAMLLVGVILICLTGRVFGAIGDQRITPPPPGQDPVIANGIIYNLWHIPLDCRDPEILAKAEFEGAGIVISTKKAVIRDGSPYKIKGNIEIDPKGCLYIEPGTVFHFAPGRGIMVNGTLIARGSIIDGKRIVMTKDPDSAAVTGPSSPWPTDARLVDGNITRDGRLELFYMGKWRGVCTNYNNYTGIDVNATCRHLGFVYGNFTYHSFAQNETDYMMYEKPGCLGSENSLFDCPGKNNVKIGAHICDGQQVIGFQCDGLRSDLAKDYWRGIEFYNSTNVLRLDGVLLYNESLSWLEYLDISYAGLDILKDEKMRHSRASISASPFVPLMNNVTITNGAYDGLNLTEIRGNIHIANSTLAYNRGYGAFIQTAVGRTLINMTDVLKNWGDGLKMYLVNYTINDFNRNFPSEQTFCQASVSSPSFPLLLPGEIIDPLGNKPGWICSKTINSSPGKMITLHVLIMEKDPVARGTFTVKDGDVNSKIILQFDIINGTFPQSITTSRNKIYIEIVYSLPPRPQGDLTKWCPTFRPCIRFLLELTTQEGPDVEFSIFNTTVINNNGYGINIQDMRSKVFVNSSVIANNTYGAGLRIYEGAGEIAVNNTVIEGNEKAGVNITYSGGYQLFNMSIIRNNHGYGVITEYLRLNRTRYELFQKMEVAKCRFEFNEWTAFRIGNYCLGGNYLFNESYFGYNMHEAIEYLSCNISTKVSTNFSLAFNNFVGNKRHAILMSPVVNTVGIITNNTFSKHTLGVLRFDNSYDFILNRWYSNFEVNYRIFENKFTENQGLYCVSMRLTQPSPFQSIEFKYNSLVFNTIKDSFMYLNPRSRANAVIIVSSGNVRVQRNYIYNPNSVRDIATHLKDPSIVIAADRNWWQTLNHSFVYSRLFDQDDRYNLAEIEYFPILKEQWLYGSFDTSDFPKYRWEFSRAGGLIGGILDGPFTTDPNRKVYHVDKDIFILKDSTFIILPGTILEFESSIGMVVHGRLKADGASIAPITFKLRDQEFLPLENRTIYDSIRLYDGYDEFEGRLELNISGQWGTVCNEGWTDQNSALVCQQLGLTYYPDYGTPRLTIQGQSQPIWKSLVSCGELDTNIFECMAERPGEFSCTHEQDVFIRCMPPTWSGITIPAIPRGGTTWETQFRYVVIEKAGLLDFAEMSFTPALQIDYNFYSISYMTVRKCISDGIHIKYCHPYSQNLIEHTQVDNNLGNGILTRSPFLRLSHMVISNNSKAGFVYDPFFTEYEALTVRNFIYRNRTVSLTNNPLINVGDIMIFLTCAPGSGTEATTYYTELRVMSDSFRVTLQLLDYNPLTSIEKVTIYDSSRYGIMSTSTKRWEIEKDLVDFPIVSSSNVLTVALEVNGVRSGRLAFAVISAGYAESNPFSQIFLYNCTIDGNQKGILTKHYNNPSNEKMEIFHRAREEEIHFDHVFVKNSKQEAMFIPSLTKYHENFIPTFEEMTRPDRIARITYFIEWSKFTNNFKGIHAEHNHVDFANNVWNWTFHKSEIQGCQSGGFEIELPRVINRIERKYHSVTVSESIMSGNQQFAFAITGYYARVSIYNTDIRDNICLLGLITISGMEKDLFVFNNRFINNYAKYGVSLDLLSHADNVGLVYGNFSYNQITGNRNNYRSTGNCVFNTPVTYGLAVKGVQNVKAWYNVIDNKELQYELVAGITSLSFTTKLDVRYSWFGVTDQLSIKERIFDFDDWNSYAIAQYFPYLTGPSFDAGLATGSLIDSTLQLNRLGGRIEADLSLPSRSDPYIVYSDLTVMPGTKFIIPPGTQLQFYPNVGILVLGQLIARGLPFARITMKPIRKDQMVSGTNGLCRRKREVSSQRTVRFIGGLEKNEGFLELYNSTTQSWNIMCDNQFNEKTAEVVCREMGFETVNVKVRFTFLYDYFVYGKPMYFLKEFWAYSYYCRGDEDSLDLCMRRINYNIKQCIFGANYTFIRCGERNLPTAFDYWGNIRFAPSQYEEQLFDFIKDEDRSRLEYLDIYGAGMLHGEKVGAIQTTYVSPLMTNINVTNCVSNGLDVVAPRYEVEIKTQRIADNLGYAVNVLVLNGDSKNLEQSSFDPLVTNTIPYNLYGLVEICRMEKEIILGNRMILFYKYSQNSLDCVKIIRGQSSIGSKNVAIRFLQFGLYQDDFYRNSIEIYDGADPIDQNRLVVLVANSSRNLITKRYVSSGNTLIIQIHASPSYAFYGFIAEVVTLPLSGLSYPDSTKFHRMEQLIIKDNQAGALLYNNVGEVNPSIVIDQCWIENNGIAILNLTSPPTIDVNLQATMIFNLDSNFINKNKGGMYIHATTTSIATKLSANITNNVFAFGSNGEVMNLTGHLYERFFIYENYIINNTAGDYRDIIHVQDVVVNFTYNTVLNNTGHYILRTYNTDRTEATQLYNRNNFYQNNVTALYRATIHVGRGNPKVRENFLVNDECDFEIETYPRTILADGSLMESTPIDATGNWWGSPVLGYISGKIWDRVDNVSLVGVDFNPYKIDNQSMIDGKCAPGWHLDSDRCYRYMGAALPYYEADSFCRLNNGFLAEIKDRQAFIAYLLRLTQNVYDPARRVWVYGEVTSGRCSAFEKNYVVEEYDCYNVMHPFICEKDPYVSPPQSDIYTAVIAISAGVFGTAVLIILILAILWYVKSKRREKEHFERQESIRSSIRGSMRTKSKSNMSMISDATSKRHFSEIDGYSQTSSRHQSVHSLGASIASLAGVTEDESQTDAAETRKQLRERAARPSTQGHRTFGRRGMQDQNGTRENDEDPSIMTNMRKKLVRQQHAANTQENGGYKHDEDQNSDSEFDEDNEDDDDDDSVKKVPLEDDDDDVLKQNGKFPHLEKSLDSIKIKPYNETAYYSPNYTPSVEFSKNSLSSFSQPESPVTPNPPRVPTPPPPLPEDINGKSNRFVPQPKPRPLGPKPVPVPRVQPTSPSQTSQSSKEYLSGSRDNVTNPSNMNRSRENFSRSRDNLTASRENIFSAQKLSTSREDVSGTNAQGYNTSFPYPGREDMSGQNNGSRNYLNQSRENVTNPSNLSHSRENLSRSRNNLTASRENILSAQKLSRSRENVADPRYRSHEYFSQSHENVSDMSGVDSGVEYLRKPGTPSNLNATQKLPYGSRDNLYQDQSYGNQQESKDILYQPNIPDYQNHYPNNLYNPSMHKSRENINSAITPSGVDYIDRPEEEMPQTSRSYSSDYSTDYIPSNNMDYSNTPGVSYLPSPRSSPTRGGYEPMTPVRFTDSTNDWRQPGLQVTNLDEDPPPYEPVSFAEGGSVEQTYQNDYRPRNISPRNGDTRARNHQSIETEI
ncbi:hypothetical protein ACJMK2_036499 [Sinanodonta woodiana]|uniref:SRCR domain-containing protein n=1 Tax=Sinanodonta woodiana TaxID=1069815 RepID=A0ABD3WLI1_SINWO